MTQQELYSLLNNINSQINSLQDQKKHIEQLLLNSTDKFLEKFMIWYNNSDKCHSFYMPRTPIINQIIQNSDRFRRGETVDIQDIIGEEDFIFFIHNKQELHEKDFVTQEEYNETYPYLVTKYMPLLKEAFDNKIKSFKLDW
jgi:hypothetical protein